MSNKENFASLEMPWLKFYKKDGRQIDVDFESFTMSMYEYMKKGNINYPDSVAIDYFDKKITFGEFFKLIDKYANSYIKQGVKAGDIVGVCMANTPEALISVYALNKIGVTVQLIHPLSSEAEIKENLNKTRAKIVIAFDSTYYKIKNIIDDTDLKRVIVASAKQSMPLVMKPLYELQKRIQNPKMSLEILKMKIKKGSISKKRIQILARQREEQINVSKEYFFDDTKLRLYRTNLELLDAEESKLEKAISHLEEKKVRVKLEDSFYSETPDDRFIAFSEFFIADDVNIESYDWGKDECAILLSTGGTSGKPKLAMLSNKNFNSMIEQFLINFDKFERGDHALSIMPLFHGFGLCSCLHLPLSFGVTVVLVPKFEANKLYRLYKKKKPEYIIGVPAIFSAIEKNKKLARKIGFSFVKLFVAGGDRLKETKERDFNNYSHTYGAVAKIAKGYGLTEGVAGVTLALDDYNEPNSVGIPMYGNIIKIVKPGTTIEVGYGEEGEICLCGPTVMLGYYNDEEETKKTLIKHEDGRTYLHTGDAGFMTNEGIIYYTQRLKRMIICNGYNIHSYQVESQIEELPFVDSCELVGKDDPTKGQVPVIYIVLKDGIKETESIKNEIITVCKKHMAGYALPSEIHFIKELPKTLLNKVAFKELEKQQKVKELTN